MRTEYKYIHFEILEEKPKTKVWACLNNRTGNELGIVKYYPAWRQYCYYPASLTVFNSGCLIDITNFIDQLNEERKKNKYAKEPK